MINQNPEPSKLFQFYLPSFYEEDKALPSNFRTFANITADPFIDRSDYEGNKYCFTLKHFLESVPRLLSMSQFDQTQTLRLKSFAQGLNQALEEIEVILGLKTIESIEKYAFEVIDKIRRLKEQEEFWLPVPWAKYGTGHAMLLRVTRRDCGQLDLIFFDSSDVYKCNSLQINPKKVQVQTSVYFENVSETKVCQTLVIRQLIEPSLRDLPLRGECSPYNFYLGLANELNASFKNLPLPFFQTLQRGGSCTAQAIYAALNFYLLEKDESSLNKIFYKKIKYYLQFQDLLDHTNDFLQNRSWTRSEHKLLLAVSRKLGRFLKKLANDNHLTNGEIEEHAKSLLDLQKKLIEKKQAAIKLAKSSLSFFLPAISGINPSHSDKAFYIIQSNTMINSEKKLAEVSQQTIQLPGFNSNDPINSIEDFIKNSLTIFKINEGVSFYPYLINSLEYVMLLPAPTLEQDAWDSVELDRIPHILQSLMQFAHYFYSFTGASAEEALFAERSLALHTILAIADKLTKRTTIGEHYLKSHRTCYLGLEYLASTSHVILSDFKKQHRLQQLLNYFNPSRMNIMEVSSLSFLFDGEVLALPTDDKVNLLNPTIQLYYHYLSDHEAELSFSYLNMPANLKILEMMQAIEGTSRYRLPIEIKSLHYLAVACMSINPVEHPFDRFYSKRSNFKFTITFQNNYANFDTFGSNYLDKVYGRELLKKVYSFRWLQPKLFHTMSISQIEAINCFFEKIPQNSIMTSYQKENERHHAIFSLNKEDEVIRTLSYYANNLSELSFEDMYALRHHLLSPGRLYELLIIEPSYAPKLLLTLKGLFEKSSLQNQIKLSLYFADLGYACQAFVREAQNTFPELFQNIDLKNSLYDYRTALLNMLSLEHPAGFVEDTLNQTLVKWHLNEYILDEAAKVEDFLCAKFFVILNPEKINPDLNVIKETTFQLQKKTLSFDIFKNPLQRNLVLNKSLHRLFKRPMDSNWEGNYPVYFSKDYKIDIESNKIYVQGSELSVLPEELSKHPHFNKTFQGIEKISVVNGDPQYLEILDRNGVSRIRFKLDAQTGRGKNSLTIFNLQKQFNQIWYERYFEIAEDSQCLFKLPCLGVSNNLKEKLNQVFGEPVCQFWRSLVEPDQWRVCNSEKIIYIDIGKRPFVISKDENHQINLCNPLQDVQSPLDLLTRFESEEFIAFWYDQNNPSLIHSFEFPRYNLHFEVKGVPKKAFSKEFPGFFIAQDQTSLFFDWEELLVLEDSMGRKKVLIPKTLFLTDYTNFPINSRGGPFAPNIRNRLKQKNAYIAGDLSIIDQKALITVYLLEDKFHLALYHFNKKQYKRASHYLFQCDVSHKIPETFIKNFYAEINEDGHPYAISLRLKAFLIFVNNSLKYHANPDSWGCKDHRAFLVEDYKQYINNIQYMDSFALTIEEEKDLIRILNSDDFNIHNRARHLANPNDTESLSLKDRIPKELNLFEISFSLYKNLPLIFLLPEHFSKDTSEKLFSTIPLTLSYTIFKNYFHSFFTMATEGTFEIKRLLYQYLTLLEGSPGLNPENLDINYIALVYLLRGIIDDSKSFSINEIRNWLNPQISGDVSKSSNTLWEDCCEELVEITIKSIQRSFAFNTKNVAPIITPYAKPHFPINLKKLNFRRTPQIAIEIDLVKFDQFFEKEFIRVFEETPHGVDISTLKMCVLELIEDHKKNIDLKILQLESLINEIPPDTSSLEIIERVGNQKPLIKLEKAIDLFREGTLKGYQENTFFSMQDIKLMDQKIGEFLILASRLEQIQRAYHLIQKYQTTESAYPLLKKIEEELKATRPYLADETFTARQKRLFLTFEYRNHLLLRAKQVSVLKEICKAPHDLQLVAKLGTGLGKSKALMSLLEWIRNENATAVINLWPSALLSNNRDDISLQVRETFNQKSNSFTFQRNTPIEEEHMIFILREFYRNIIEQKQINATPQSFICLELKFLEVLRNNSQNVNVILNFQKILGLLRKMEVHVDESQISLASKSEVNFTIGDSMEVPKAHVLLIKDLYEKLAQEPSLGLQQNLQTLISAETYKQTIQKVVNDYLKNFEIPDECFAEVRKYILEEVSAIPSWVEKSSKKDLIGLLRGEVRSLLKDSLQRSTNVNYGLSHEPQKRGEHAKPYAANNQPIENADYENSHETLNKTFQTYLYQGLTLDQLWTLIIGFQNQIKNEFQRGCKGLENSETYQLFKNIFPSQLEDIATLTKEKIAAFYPLCAHEPQIIFKYVVDYIAPLIEIYENKLRGDAQTLKSMFKNVIAMSATPGSSFVYGREFSSFYHLQNESEVLQVLKDKCQHPETIRLIPTSKPEDILKYIMEHHFKGNAFSMLIDIGALFEGMNNVLVAKFLLEHFEKQDSEMKGVVFYEEDRLMILEKGNSNAIPFNQSFLKPSQRFAYCDNQHIFGADIPLPELAKGFATFNIQVDKDSLLQGTGRLRDFLKGQSIVWGLTEACSKVIFDQQTFTIEHLIQHAEKKQKVKDEDDLQRSLRQQMRNVVRNFLMRKLIHTPPAEASQLYYQYAAFFEDRKFYSPFVFYGQIESEMSGSESLRLCYNEIKKQIEELQGVTEEERSNLFIELNSFETMIEQLKDELPQKVLTTALQVENQVQVFKDVEKNKETEKEKQQEYEVELNSYVSTRSHVAKAWPEICDPFTLDWKNPIVTKTKKISDFATKLLNIYQLAKITYSQIKGVFLSKKLNALRFLTFPAVALMTIVAGPIFAILGALAGIAKLHRLRRPELIQVKVETPSLLSFQERMQQANLVDPLGCTGIYFTDNLVDQAELIIPFSYEEKPIYEILVVEENEQFTLIVGDQDSDATFWRKKIVDEKNKHNPNAKRKVCLFDLREGIVLQGYEAFDEKTLMKDPEFLRKLVSIKIYNGELFCYSQEEIDILSKMCKDPEKKLQLKNLLEASLKFKQQTKRLFPTSFLYALLGP